MAAAIVNQPTPASVTPQNHHLDGLLASIGNFYAKDDITGPVETISELFLVWLRTEGKDVPDEYRERVSLSTLDVISGLVAIGEGYRRYEQFSK